MYPAIKVRESVRRRYEAYGETPKIFNPNKHTGFDKFKIGGLSIKLFIGVCPLFISEGCPHVKQISLFWKRFSYMAQACVRESVRT